MDDLDDYGTIPLLVRCTARDSGGARCEVFVPTLDTEHEHFATPFGAS